MKSASIPRWSMIEYLCDWKRLKGEGRKFDDLVRDIVERLRFRRNVRGTRQVISVGSDDGWIKIHDGRRARGPGRGSSGAPTRSATSINSSSLNSGAMLIPLPPLPLKPSSFELEWNFSRNLCSIMSERSIQPMISSVSSCCTCRSQRRRFQGKRSYRRIVCVRR